MHMASLMINNLYPSRLRIKMVHIKHVVFIKFDVSVEGLPRARKFRLTAVNKHDSSFSTKN